MLDLQARIHFQEVELAVRREQELDRPGSDVADRLAGADGRVGQPGAQSPIHRGRRRFLDDLLMAALDRAFALVQRDDVPCASPKICTSTCRAGVISRSRNTEPSPNADAASRRAESTAPRAPPAIGDRAHAAAAAAERSLDQQGKSDAIGGRQERVTLEIADVG